MRPATKGPARGIDMGDDGARLRRSWARLLEGFEKRASDLSRSQRGIGHVRGRSIWPLSCRTRCKLPAPVPRGTGPLSNWNDSEMAPQGFGIAQNGIGMAGL